MLALQAISAIRRLPLGLYDGVHVYSKTPMKDIEILRNALKTINHHGIGIEGWWQQNGNFFSAMELEKRALFIVLMLIILMASLNIISSLLMVVMNRRKEIALLFSMGSSQKEIQKPFLFGQYHWFRRCGAWGGFSVFKHVSFKRVPYHLAPSGCLWH